MDLEDWEILPDDGRLEFSRKKGKMGADPNFLVELDYFLCPSQDSHHGLETTGNSGNQEFVKGSQEVPVVEKGVVPPPVELEKIVAADQDPISHVFFKKMKENEFVDIKMDSPKSSNWAFKPLIESGPIQFEEKEDCHGEDSLEDKTPKVVTEQENGNNYQGPEIKDKGLWEGCGLNIGKWRITGIGTLCSIGVVAAATFCIFILGSHQKHKQQQNQKLQYQIYAEDKGIKQVVQHATRMNQALSGVRGAPLARAHITCGGAYNGL